MVLIASTCMRYQIFLSGVLIQVQNWGRREKKLAGSCSDPDDRVDLSPEMLFSKPPGSKPQHTHICHSAGILENLHKSLGSPNCSMDS